MKETEDYETLSLRVHEGKEALKENNDYDNYFLRKLVDNSLINTFGILEASKIQYDLQTTGNLKDFQIKSLKK